MAKKVFVLDTNVLIHDPRSLESFEGATVVVPMMVLEELDQFKKDNSERGRNARAVIRNLDALRARGSLRDGVKLDSGCIVQVTSADIERKCINFPRGITDNYILNMVMCMKQDGLDVVLVSKDLNVRVKADVLGIKAVDYTKEEVSLEQFYHGWVRIQVPSIQLKKPVPPDLLELAEERTFTLNEYVIVQSQHNEFSYRVFRFVGDKQFKPVDLSNLHWGIAPRNPQQAMVLDLLLDDSIQCAILSGPAGTGKTFLALVAGLQKILVDHTYEKMLISRPVIPLGPDIGYLPGTVGEKLHSWMQPIYDNMEFIMHVANASRQQLAIQQEEQGRDRHDRFQGNQSRRRDRKKEFRHQAFPSLDDLVHRGKISLEAITYMRGRSIPYQFIFIDEVQNLSPHEVKTIISRVGEGSKIVLAGDPYQIDSPYLDFVSNGLMVASERFKGNRLFGSVFLETSERSELSKLASTLL